MGLRLNGSTSGYSEISAPAIAGDHTSGAGNIQTVTIPNMRATPSVSFYGSATASNASFGANSGNTVGANTAQIYAVTGATGGWQVVATAGNGYQYNAEL